MAAYALLVFAALGSTADNVHENVARGIQPEKMYHFTEVDQVNLFNGNLTLSIPIGGSYPVSERLSWGLSLSYNSKAWETREYTPPGQLRTFEYLPSKRFNAGHGWLLSLGRLFSDQDGDYNTVANWVYESPDGADHIFEPTIHGSDAEPVLANTFYSTDETYLRLKVGYPLANQAQVQFPDGTVHTFTAYNDGGTRRYRLTRVEDSFNNFYAVTYSADGSDEIWTITDMHQRTATIRFGLFVDAQSGVINWPQRGVKSVVLPAFGGTDQSPRTVQYLFDVRSSVLRGPNCGEGSSPAVSVPRLYSVRVTSVASPVVHTFDYHDSDGCNAALLRSMTLPTGGKVTWQYGPYSLPIRSCESPVNETPGVMSRTLSQPGHADSVWRYKSTPIEDGTTVLAHCPNEVPFKVRSRVVAHHTVTTTVTSPLGDETVHYFAAWSGMDPHQATGHTRFDYGLPFSGMLRKYGSTEKFISTRTCRGACTSEAAIVRETYANYDREVRRKGGRRSGLRTEYYWGGVTNRQSHYEEVDYDDFDGVGHYRNERKSGTFTGNGGPRHTRTTYNIRTADNPTAADTGTYSPQSPATFKTPLPAKWILNTYSSTTTVESGSKPLTQEYCFDPQTGFLRATRMLAGDTRGPTDIIRVFAPDVRGATTRELVYGGDSMRLMNEGAAPCAAAATPPGSPEYDFQHRYSYGVRSETQRYDKFGQPVESKALDTDIDRNTGLVAVSRDSARLATFFNYDALRRITATVPPGLQPISVEHEMATPVRPARSIVTQASAQGSGVIRQEVEFDGFGRVSLERRLMPDGQWAQRRTLYDLNGARSGVSEWALIPDSFRLFVNPDPLGRPEKIHEPDGSVTRYEYDGAHIVRRTSTIATSHGTGAEEPATTVEYRDVHGRLYRVDEPGLNTITNYHYDSGNRLSRVDMAGGSITQERRFEYDGRGFLKSEKHPEKGPHGNGWVVYPCHDALGNVLRKIDGTGGVFDCESPSQANPNGTTDVTYGFDGAGRLTSVRETNGRMLKEFFYSVFSSPPSCVGNCDWSLGKLKTAIRHNWHPYATKIDMVVKENFTYSAPGGALSSKTTTLGLASEANAPSFTQNYAYDDLGSRTAVDFPRCSGGSCGTTPSRVIQQRYVNGSVAAVPGFTASGSVISYWPNGLTRMLPHANGVVDSTQISDNDMPRPLSITFAGYRDTPGCSAPTIVPPNAVTIPYDTSADLAVTAHGSNGLTYEWFDAQPTATSQALYVGAVFRTPRLTRTTTFWVRVTDGCASAFTTASITVHVRLPAPQTLTATYDASANRIVVAWTPIPGDVQYSVERSADGALFQTVATGLSQPAFSDGSTTPWTGYLYRVTASSASGDTSASTESNVDFAVAAPFTNAPAVYGIHVGELRRAADGMRSAAGLPRLWNGQYQQAAGTVIHAADISGVRDVIVAAAAELTRLYGTPVVSLDTVRPADIIEASFFHALRQSTR